MEESRRREAYLWIVIIILVLSLLYVVTLNLWGLSLWGDAVDYTRFGTWSQTVSGIGTTVAVIVALSSLLWQRRSQRSTDAKRLVEIETAVHHWMTSKEVRDEHNNKLIGRLWDIRIQNLTVAPIYRWKINFLSETDHLCGYVRRPLLPGENVFNLKFLDNVEPSKAPEPTLSFEGRSGAIWSRTSRGVIVKTTKENIDCEHGILPVP